MNRPFSPSRAEEFFREISAATDQFGFIEGLIGGELGEGEFVDYKSGMESAGPLSKEAVNGIWSKALSGFGNADGGVIVWGINARDNLPTSLALVPDAQKLEGRLKKSLPNATEPPLQGVEILSITKPDSGSQGFVVCFIPPSPWRPHKAKWPEAESDYFIRIGDNCVPAPHSTLRALFYPSSAPWIEIYAVYRREGGNCLIDVFVCNTGLGTANDLFVIIETGGLDIMIGFHGFKLKGAEGYPGRPHVAERPIHPGEKAPLAILIHGFYQTRKEVQLKFRVFMRDQPPTYHRLTVPADIQSGVRLMAEAGMLPQPLRRP